MGGFYDGAASSLLWVCAAVALYTVTESAGADDVIHLELRPPFQTVDPGNTVDIGLYAVSDEGEQGFSALNIVFAWNPTCLELLGLDHSGAVPLGWSYLPAGDPFGVNEIVPPADGNGLYIATSPGPGMPVMTNEEGVLIVTFQFQAIESTPHTEVELLPYITIPGYPICITEVYDDDIPGLNILGTISNATVEITGYTYCPEDLDQNLVVNVTDLLMLLGEWGNTGTPGTVLGDINEDGVVNVSDLLLLLGAWGPCPPP